jgi:hypothetical protein
LKHGLYYPVRYVPNLATGRFVNVGLLLYCPDAQFLDCLFTDDFRDAERLDSQADLELLRELQPYFEQEIKEHENDLAGYIRGIEDSYSNLIQISDPELWAADDLEATLAQLFETYVGARAGGPPKPDTRMRIKRRLADALERHGVTGHKALEKDIPAAQWTCPSDTFTFDFGYTPVRPAREPDGELRLIHALSLLRDSDLAETLRSKFDTVLEKRPARLTVAHDDIDDPSNALVRSSQSALRSGHILLVPVAWFDQYGAPG